MSFVSAYVRAVDGKLYRDPVVEGDGWFVCFDDDDPPELVVKAAMALPELPFIKIIGGNTRSFRDFSDDPDASMIEADSYWCKLVKPIPVPRVHDGVVDRKDISQSVIYDPEGGT